MNDKIQQMLEVLTIEEKASLCSGTRTFSTTPILRIGIPMVEMADGPHGLRKKIEQQGEREGSHILQAVCFPAACAMGASFDPELSREMGIALADACRKNGINVLLGPGINIKRSPLCGRNFEYYSEDPYLAGQMGAGWVEGLQSQGVGASLKHFLANNQEARRRTYDSCVSERALREIYAAAFEYIVKVSDPWIIMAAYNKVNGQYATENPVYLRKMLRDEWGYKGLVVSDWHAVHDRVAAVQGGCALTMPENKRTDHLLSEAVEKGVLSAEILDEACSQIITLALKSQERFSPLEEYDFEKAHMLAKQLAEGSIVLLKNEGVLPLKSERNITIIGAFADAPRYQGEGSSHINSWKVPTMREVIKADKVSYYDGFRLNEDALAEDFDQALEAARKADAVIIMAGLPPVMEAEGYDRWVMKLPRCQNELIEKICACQKNTVVVLQNGAPVEMPWRDQPNAIVEAYLGGEAVCEALWNVLTGKVNPSGHLPETFPERLEDNPSYLFWPGNGDTVNYGEDVFVGYRYYNTKNIPVAYPFGHGLSYTSFRFQDLKLSQHTFCAGEQLSVTVTVTNTGSMQGKTLVQLYVGCDIAKTGIRRPVRELRRFQKVLLTPGESREVTFALDKRCFAVWDMETHNWRVPGGQYDIQICENAQDVVLSQAIMVSDEYLPTGKTYDIMSPIGDAMKTPIGKAFCEKLIPGFMKAVSKRTDIAKQHKLPYEELCPEIMGLMSEPLQTLKRFSWGVTEEQWQAFFTEINNANEYEGESI